MKVILNKTRKALKVPLPQGKSLHLPPAKSGQIADNAVEHPPLKRLIDAGEIEVQGAGVRPYERSGFSDESAHGAVSGHHPATGSSPRKGGDRGG